MKEKSKDSLRKILAQQRDSISYENKIIYDKKIFDFLIHSDFYISSKIIFIYVSFKNEVYTHKMIDYLLKSGKIVCVPKVISKEKGMKAVQIKDFYELKSGKYGILEPENLGNIILPQNVELAIIPGLAFDLKGGRLGYGGGYYDRFLRLMKDNAFKYGLGYFMQIVDKVPEEPWDVRLNGIITEKKIIKSEN